MGSGTEKQVSSGIKEYKKCFVGYVDVLGFTKEVLRSHHPDTLSRSLKILLKNIKQYCRLEKDSENQDSLPFKFTWMSDNLLFYTEDDSIDRFRDISDIIAYFSLTTIEAGPFLFRGALSHGDFYFDRQWNLYFGPAMVDAIKWEKKQNWAGLMLTPVCSDFVKKNNYDSLVTRMRANRVIGTKLIEISGPLVVDYEVPFKNEECHVHVKERLSLEKSLCINWTVDFRALHVESSKLGKLLSSLECEVDRESIKEKVDNTLEFLKYCKQFEKRTVLQ